MTDKDIKNMISQLVEELDYDTWKELFLEDYDYDDEQGDRQKALVEICRKFIK